MFFMVLQMLIKRICKFPKKNNTDSILRKKIFNRLPSFAIAGGNGGIEIPPFPHNHIVWSFRTTCEGQREQSRFAGIYGGKTGFLLIYRDFQ